MFGGGREYYRTTGNGGRQLDRDLWTELTNAGYDAAKTKAEMSQIKKLPAVGLFAMSHMDYELDRIPDEQPSLLEMTTKALELLVAKNNDKGFMLLIEGSRIDMACHSNDSPGALGDAWMYDQTVGVSD
eukprot:TRINITY_DN27349_c0_g1_i1.p2 TRINITY_DN27349_c0_g1~~TRINITY_DN27349_c0_g1_i1.p2  ORF type:complete len:129 (-),score=45.69 TRINITY_DN27349_c0_g1_i1:2-388(-)